MLKSNTKQVLFDIEHSVLPKSAKINDTNELLAMLANENHPNWDNYKGVEISQYSHLVVDSNAQSMDLLRKGPPELKEIKGDVSKFVGKFYEDHPGIIASARDGRAAEEVYEEIFNEFNAILNKGSIEFGSWASLNDVAVLMSHARETAINCTSGHNFKTVYNAFKSNISRKITSKDVGSYQVERGAQKLRLQLLKEAQEQGYNLTLGFGVPSDMAQGLKGLNPFDKGNPEVDAYIKRMYKQSGYKQEDFIQRFSGLISGAEKHVASEDTVDLVLADTILKKADKHFETPGAKFTDFIKNEWHGLRSQILNSPNLNVTPGSLKLEDLSTKELFQHSMESLFPSKAAVAARRAETSTAKAASTGLSAATKTVRAEEGTVSRLVGSVVESNKALKYVGIGAAALVGVSVLTKLFSSAGDDDRSNNTEALLGKSHKYFGVFGSGFKGDSSYIDQKVEELKNKNTLYVGGSYVGLPNKDIKKKLMTSVQARLSSNDAIKVDNNKTELKGFAAVSAEFGEVVHKVLEKEAQKKGGTPEYKFSDPKTGLYGSMDTVKGDVVEEYKTVTPGIFNVISNTGKPYPAHLLQLNAYLGVLGKTKGRLVYVNRENLKQRVTFNVTFGSKEFQRTARKVKAAQKAVVRELESKGVNLESISDGEAVIEKSAKLPSDKSLNEQYAVALFKGITTRRGMASESDKIKRERQVRTRKYNTIESLRHGWFGTKRRETTDFGSGFRPEDEWGTSSSEWGARAVALGILGGGAYLYAKHPEALFKAVQTVEDRSPFQILRTFGVSSSIQPRALEKSLPESLIFTPDQVFSRGFNKSLLVGKSKFDASDDMLTPLGRMFKERFGTIPLQDYNVAFTKGLGGKFVINVPGRGRAYTEFHTLDKLRTSARYYRDPELAPLHLFKKTGEERAQKMFGWMADAFGPAGESLRQFIIGKKGDKRFKIWSSIEQVRASESAFRPFIPGDPTKTLVPGHVSFAMTRAGVEADLLRKKAASMAMGGMERFNKLLSQFGLGAPSGSYNRLVTPPVWSHWSETSVGKSVGKALNLTPKSRGLVNVLLARRFAPIVAGLGALGLADYATGHALSNLPVRMYSNFKVGMAQIGQVTGLRKLKEKFNDISPVSDWKMAVGLMVGGVVGGHIFSTLAAKTDRIEPALKTLGIADKFSHYSKYVRQGKGALAGKEFSPAYLRMRKASLAKGFKVGLLASIPFLAAALIPKESPQELKDIYSGKKEVEIKRNRGWEISSTPYSGDRVKEYRQHWIPRFLNRQWVKDEYGSEGEYWKRSLKTPIGWFNLIVNPYAKEKNAEKRGRRFPMTEELFTDVPFIGPIARFAGYTLKPPRLMHASSVDKLRSIARDDEDAEPSKRLGGLGPLKPRMPGSFRNVLAETFNQYTTMAGLPGFLFEATHEKLFGVKNPLVDKSRPTMETASTIGDTGRQLYGMELGGGFFTTEALRRIVYKPNKLFGEEFNPIPNNMPSWLAGSNELLKLGQGDIYSKAGFNQRYIPGKEFNERMELPRNLSPEDYPNYYKMMILSHLQPYSRKISRMETELKEEDLTSYQRYNVETWKSQIDAIKKKEKFDKEKFTGDISKYTGTVESVSGEYVKFREYPNKEFKLGSVSFDMPDIANNISRQDNEPMQTATARADLIQEAARRSAESRLAPGTRVSFAAEKYAPENLNKADIAIIDGSLFNKKLKDRYDLPYSPSGPIDQLMYGPIRRGLGQAAEIFSRNPPLPFMAKFMGTSTYMDKYEGEQVYGPKLKLWETPLKSFVYPTAWGVGRKFNTLTGAFNLIPGYGAGGNSIPALENSDVHKQFGVFGSGFLNMFGNIMTKTTDKLLKLFSRNVNKVDLPKLSLLEKARTNARSVEKVIVNRGSLNKNVLKEFKSTLGVTYAAKNLGDVRDAQAAVLRGLRRESREKARVVQRAFHNKNNKALYTEYVFTGKGKNRKPTEISIISKTLLENRDKFAVSRMAERASKREYRRLLARNRLIEKAKANSLSVNKSIVTTGLNREQKTAALESLGRMYYGASYQASMRSKQAILLRELRSKDKLSAKKALNLFHNKLIKSGGEREFVKNRSTFQAYVFNYDEVLYREKKADISRKLRTTKYGREKVYDYDTRLVAAREYKKMIRGMGSTEHPMLSEEGAYKAYSNFEQQALWRAKLFKKMVSYEEAGLQHGIVATDADNMFKSPYKDWAKIRDVGNIRKPRGFEGSTYWHGLDLHFMGFKDPVQTSILDPTKVVTRAENFATKIKFLIDNPNIEVCTTLEKVAALGTEVGVGLKGNTLAASPHDLFTFINRQSGERYIRTESGRRLVASKTELKEILAENIKEGNKSISHEIVVKGSKLDYIWVTNKDYLKDATELSKKFNLPLHDYTLARRAGPDILPGSSEAMKIKGKPRISYPILESTQAPNAVDALSPTGPHKGVGVFGSGLQATAPLAHAKIVAAFKDKRTWIGAGIALFGLTTLISKGKSKTKRTKDDYEEYFDKLEFLKNLKLSKQADLAGDDKMAKYFMVKARSTMIGADPYTAEPEALLGVLPKNERPYFMEFINEPDPHKRRKILNLVPAAERRLLLGQWFRQKTHVSAQSDIEQKELREIIENEGFTEGLSEKHVKSLVMKYGKKIPRNMIERMGEIHRFMKDKDFNIPDESWNGWKSEIDMKDQKLMYLKSQGENIHEYDMWDNDVRSLYRKPYLKGSVKPLRSSFNNHGAMRTMNSILKDNAVISKNMSVLPTEEQAVNMNFSIDVDSYLNTSDFNSAIMQSMAKTHGTNTSRSQYDPTPGLMGD